MHCNELDEGLHHCGGCFAASDNQAGQKVNQDVVVKSLLPLMCHGVDGKTRGHRSGLDSFS